MRDDPGCALKLRYHSITCSYHWRHSGFSDISSMCQTHLSYFSGLILAFEVCLEISFPTLCNLSHMPEALHCKATYIPFPPLPSLHTYSFTQVFRLLVYCLCYTGMLTRRSQGFFCSSFYP